MENNVFSARRMGAFIKLYAQANRRTLLAMGAATVIVNLAAFLLPMLLTTFSRYSSAPAYQIDESVDPMQSTVLGLSLFAGTILLTVAGSLMYSAMSSKAQRLRTLTLPASQLEKALAGFLYYIVGFLVVYALSFVLCDLLRVAIVKLFAPNPQYGHLVDYGWFFTLDGMEWLALIVGVGVVLFGQSIFTLGGIVWYKRAYIKTLVYLWVVQVCCSILGTISAFIFFNDARPEPRIDISRQWLEAHIIPVNISVAALILLILLGMQALAFWRFRQSDLVHRW